VQESKSLKGGWVEVYRFGATFRLVLAPTVETDRDDEEENHGAGDPAQQPAAAAVIVVVRVV